MSIKFFLAQFETYLGDLEGNFSKLKKFYEKAEKSESDLLLTTELEQFTVQETQQGKVVVVIHGFTN